MATRRIHARPGRPQNGRATAAQSRHDRSQDDLKTTLTRQECDYIGAETYFEPILPWRDP
eukprot:336062-Pyramimonas_sp.AAC.1